MRTIAISLALLCFVVVPSPPASADDAEQAAKDHFQRGQALLAAGRYREARAEFSAGYDLSARPAFLFNMGECSRLAGAPDQAVASYRAYLAAEPAGQLAGLARQRLAELGAATADPGAAAPPAPPLALPRLDPAAPAATDPRPLVLDAPLGRRPADRPLWKKWPFWAVVGGTAVAGATTAFILTRDTSVACGAACIDLR